MTAVRIRLARPQLKAALAVADTHAALILESGVFDPGTRMMLVDVPQDARLAVRCALHEARQTLAAPVYAAHFERAMKALLT